MYQKRKYRTLYAVMIVICLLLTITGVYVNEPSLIYPFLGLTIILLALKVRAYFKAEDLKREFKSGSIDFVKNCIEILAFLLAGLYFLYQFIGHVDVTNLSIKLSVHRSKLSDSTDHLAITAHLEKGSVASLYFHDMVAYLYHVDDTNAFAHARFPDINYVNPKKTHALFRTTYNASETTDTKRKYRIAANEATQFTTYRIIPKSYPTRIKVILIGERTKLLHKVYPQFTAGAFSLPLPGGTNMEIKE